MSENVTAQTFELFKHALTEENLELQITTIQKLKTLAKALGEVETRKELLPFIELHYTELHDEVLLNLAEQLQSFIPLVGGLKHSKPILDILGRLCITDENVVREKAVEVLIAIQQDLSMQDAEEYLLPVIDKVIKDDWFTSKCSAVMLFSPLYPKLGKEGREAMRNNFKLLIQDDSPMVRKAAATACVNFVNVVEDDFLKTEFVPIFKDIAQDPMDSVRSVTIDIALALAKRLQHDNIEDIFKTVEAASDDASWRIRQRLAYSIAKLQQNIPYGKYRGKLLSLFQKLTQDMEPEVRILAAQKLIDYCRYLKESYIRQQHQNNFEPVFEQSIMTVIQRLSMDENEDVRLSLSSNILLLSSVLSEESFKKNIIPFLLHVLEREESIAIQTNFLLGLSSLPSNVDLNHSLSAIKNAIRAVIVRSQCNWRTRRSILMTFMDIAKFCTPNYFSDHFKIYYAALLGDSVFAVRRSATLILPIISKHYGIKWASEHLVPYFTMFTKDSRYLYRFVSLFGISEMVHPQLCAEPNSYLNDFKEIINNKESPNNKDAIIALAKIVKTSHLVQKELKEEKYCCMLKLKNKINYISKCDSSIYSEKDFEKLRQTYKDINIFSIKEEEMSDRDQWPYLQGILGLIYNKFLPIISVLNNDPTENVQIRSLTVLGEISDFITKLNKEESRKWVYDSLQSLTPDEIHNIIDEIHHEFKTADFQDEDIAENINMDLMETSNVPNLSQTICIENSNSSDNTDKNENTKMSDVLKKHFSQDKEYTKIEDDETENQKTDDLPKIIISTATVFKSES